MNQEKGEDMGRALICHQDDRSDRSDCYGDAQVSDLSRSVRCPTNMTDQMMHKDLGFIFYFIGKMSDRSYQSNDAEGPIFIYDLIGQMLDLSHFSTLHFLC